MPISTPSALPDSLIEALHYLDPSECYLLILPLENSSAQPPIMLGRDLFLDEVICLDTHPVRWLLGLDLSKVAAGLAVVSPGRVVPYPHDRLDAGPEAGETANGPEFAVGDRVSAIAVVEANGQSSLHVADAHSQRLLAPNAFGLVPDAMRRALGLTTAPVTIDPGWYWAFRWLQDLHEDGRALSPELLDLDDAICAHPVVEPSELAGLSWLELGQFCRQRHVEHSWLTGWQGIRSGLASTSWKPEPDSRFVEVQAAARWYDDGSFSRWFLSQQPTLTEVFDTVSMMLTPAAAELVRSIVLEVVHGSEPTAPC